MTFTKPPFQLDLFLDQALEPNKDFRRVYRHEHDHTELLLRRIAAGLKLLGLTFDEYVGVEGGGHGHTHHILDWYGNGRDAPEDRPGMFMLLHPQVHKRFWETLAEQATQIAQQLRRWVWVVEAEKSRWVMFLFGGDPEEGDEDEDGAKPAWRQAVRPTDQYIAVISPDGEWRTLGAS